MNKKTILSILFAICINSLLFAQDIQLIKRRITCLNDTVSVPYAHIGILGTGIGTVSNINGDFELKGKFNIQKDTLIISHIEYEKKLIPLTELAADTNNIKLIRNEYLLADVIVLPKEKITEILKSVIINLKKNYSDKLYQSEAFYREVQYDERTKTYSRLIEAALNIQDGKITAPISKIKCSFLQFRKSDNFTNEHWGVKALKKLFDMPNFLHILLRDNTIRGYQASKNEEFENRLRHITEEDLDNLRIQGIIRKNNDEIYVFQYSHKGNSSTFYVNKNNYAVLQYDFKFETKNKTLYKSTYHFKKIREKYYPAFCSYLMISDVRSNSEGLGFTENSLTFVDYHLDKKTFKRVRHKHVLPNEVDLYDQEMVYDKNFWATYNILLDEPLDDKVVSDLEKEKSLQTQFEKNAATKEL